MNNILSLPGYGCLENYYEKPKQTLLDRVSGYKPKTNVSGLYLGQMNKSEFLLNLMTHKIPSSCIRFKDTGNVILPV